MNVKGLIDGGFINYINEQKEILSNEWEIASLEVSKLRGDLKEHSENIVIMTNRMHCYESTKSEESTHNRRLAESSVAGRKQKSKRNKNVEKCNSAFCIVTVHDINIDWALCDDCDSWYHTMCEALTPQEEISLTDNAMYKCVVCAGIEDIGDIYRSKISLLIDEEELINVSSIAARILCDDLKAKYSDIMGDREKRLSDALDSIKVVRQAYHGNVMVGNHCVIVLNRYHVLTDIIADNEEMCSKFNVVFSIYSNAMKLIMARRFPNDEEIDDLCQQCKLFGEVFPTHFPQRNITRKIHELVFNLPRFVRVHKTIGLLSEQEGESKHAAVNAELRSLASMRNHADRLHLVLKRKELRSYMNKGLLKPKTRLCINCSNDHIFKIWK